MVKEVLSLILKLKKEGRTNLLGRLQVFDKLRYLVEEEGRIRVVSCFLKTFPFYTDKCYLDVFQRLNLVKLRHLLK